ncbi:MAG: N-6 DNA methylase [Pirellulales bacterium]
MPTPSDDLPFIFSIAAPRKQESAARNKREEKRSQGSYYTREDVAQTLVRKTLEYLPESNLVPRIIDPACGAGVLLVEAYLQLLSKQAAFPDLAGRVQLAKRCLFGIDQNSFAVSTARLTLASAILGRDFSADQAAVISKELTGNIRCGDALLYPPEAMFAWQEEDFSSSLDQPGFDVVLSNPPYKNIRQIARTHGPQMQKHLRETYRCAQGSFDLYMLFVERAYDLLAKGGIAGMLIPNRWTSALYAKAGRALLLEKTRLQEVIDLSSLALFEQADVYPQIVLFQKEFPDASHQVRFQSVATAEELGRILKTSSQVTLQKELSPKRISFASEEVSTAPLMQRITTRPLAQRVKLVSGMSGFASQRLLAATSEANAPENTGLDPEQLRPLVVSGNLDRFHIRQGNVRYIKHDFLRPVVRLDHPGISPQKRILFTQPKILVAGLSKQLEVAYDQQGLAIGVQVFAMTLWKDDPFWLLALLNSRLITMWYREQFAGKQLSCGYVPINKGPLGEIPIPCLGLDAPEELRAMHQQLAAIGWKRHHEPPHSPKAALYDAQIDALVEKIYQVTPEESQHLQVRHQELLASLRAKTA